MTRQELIARLEAATCGSMGLSREVARAVGWVNRGNSAKGEWFAPEDVRDGKPVLDSLHGTEYSREPPDFTRSLDAAVTLVPDGWGISLHMSPPTHNCSQSAELMRGKPPYFDDVAIDAIAATAILALCIACLKARGET